MDPLTKLSGGSLVKPVYNKLQLMMQYSFVSGYSNAYHLLRILVMKNKFHTVIGFVMSELDNAAVKCGIRFP